MRIATVNVNGIRAAARKGMGQWMTDSAPDILLLQEVRADEQIAAGLLEGYTAATWPCRIKGRAGVSIAVREGGPATIGELRHGVAPEADQEPDVDSGRWLEADLALADGSVLTVISAYLHSGQLGTEKMDQKYAHLDLVDARMAALLQAAQQGGPQVLMAGDLNVVRSERDIKNWKPNHNRIAGVMDEEIAHLESWFSSGWVDVSRALVGPEAQGPYTWWSQRGKAFDNDAGWRIDYQVATPALAERATGLSIDRAPDYASRWSDHAPLVIEYDGV
ncbi:exodeoxyribonuclease III [Actinomyces bowdenii]|uniref:Endonuclease/exonuclease/phosphatase family protein n=1 Tax=Actinomyces bowdenii TaxID=131109 RepID=A0A853ELE0_9ACTO|nr:exodeoxyribonuclease III [Actinomyces bowdenii]MBF0697502.1 endonuclease/exonuclease/phosphatase family protein [Actinomyces bowdenii]NYS69675.1 endonuclease/exonuclease/phosphatase family protein [Actinomyces bowdenii]